MNKEEFDQVLEKKGIVKDCRKLWWKHWEPYQAKFGGSRESLENFVTAVIEKGCQASCGL